MKIVIVLLLPVLLCASCTALPAEERAFCVALCVEKTDAWRVYGRIPTYQSGGGYMTVTGTGETLASALSGMDTASPMRINLSQLRLLAADVNLARSGDLPALLSALAQRPDIRMECTVALTDMPVRAVAEALKPAAGSRLSKALDLMLAARVEQGVILPSALADVHRMEQRQMPVLAALTLEGEEIILAGGCTTDGTFLTADETALLSLLLEHAKSLHLSLPGGTAQVRDAKGKVRLSEDLAEARVELTLNATSSSFTADGLEAALVEALLSLLPRLSAAGCDALGLGRQAIMGVCEMTQWHAMNWQERYRSIRWEVSVGVNGGS